MNDAMRFVREIIRWQDTLHHAVVSLMQTLPEKHQRKLNDSGPDCDPLDLALYRIRQGFAAFREYADELQREAVMWKCNHDNQVRVNRALRDRPDLGDRAKSVQALVDEITRLRATQVSLASVQTLLDSKGVTTPVQPESTEPQACGKCTRGIGYFKDQDVGPCLCAPGTIPAPNKPEPVDDSWRKECEVGCTANNPPLWWVTNGKHRSDEKKYLSPTRGWVDRGTWILLPHMESFFYTRTSAEVALAFVSAP